jgi:puromycin-sensitive aminopeptidase
MVTGTPTSDTSRLPRNVEPVRYAITLAPDLRSARFRGHEEILIRILGATDRIVMNAAELKVFRVELSGRAGTTVRCTPKIDEEDERLIVHLDKAVPAGEWTLSIDFEGVLNDKLHGFYRSTFRDSEGNQQTIATTQFEATDARRAFPCWDEPDRKAVFSVTLEVDSELNAYSNTPIVSSEAIDSRTKRVRFADTPKMSTYLVAFVVGPLVSTPPVDVDGVSLAVVHPPGRERLTGFALEIGAHALRFFTEWFSIPYPGEKLDLIAIPDFAFGAMENLGAVTFRETALLVDPEASARVEQERVADVVAHEIAHMWFGDLVTMKWWNGIWLNEAFATFAEMACVDSFRPNWQRWVTFGLSRSNAMVTDELASTRPIEYPVIRPEDAQGMFDVLTYEKGAAVLRMLERYLGTPIFLEGLRRYLEAHLFGNAETTDLWDAIEDASGEPVRSTMDSWIFQGGHPLVRASLRSSEEGTFLDLSQQPFRLGPPPLPPKEDSIGSDWQVPLQVRTVTAGHAESYRLLLGPDGAGIELTGDPDLVVVNAEGTGFFRTCYDAMLQQRIQARLADLDPVELFNLVSDAWAMSLHDGPDALGTFLELVASLEVDEPNVWTAVASSIGLLDLIAEGDGRDRLKQFVRRTFGRRLEAIGREASPGEDEKIGTLRAVLVRTLGTVGADEEVRAWSAKAFASFRSGGASIDPDLSSAVAATLAAAGDPAHYEQFLEIYRHPENPQEEVRYLFALPGFSDPELFRRTLEIATTEVRTQNAPFVIAYALGNRDRRRDAWAFVVENWERINEAFPAQLVSRMLDAVSSLCIPDLAPEVDAFLDAHPLRTGQRTVDQAREKLAVNLAFSSKVGPSLPDILSDAEARA